VAKTFSLGEKERLKSREAIDRLFRNGKKFMIAPWRVFYFSETITAGPPVLFGTAVSTRNFKRAVDRNRIKRLSREGWRLQKRPLQEKIKNKGLQLQVFVVFTGQEIPPYDQVFSSMGAVIKRLDKIINE
jgi:ribonuclease P protein component